MLVYDIIKIRYSADGFLPNYPYHLISDVEMFNAFILNDVNFFDTYYPDPVADTGIGSAPYYDLKTAILYHVDRAIATAYSETPYTVPDWVISYMLGVVVGANSGDLDMRDLNAMLGTESDSDAFTEKTAEACYKISSTWLKRTGQLAVVDYNGNLINQRPATVFGEPHVIKSLRLSAASPF